MRMGGGAGAGVMQVKVGGENLTFKVCTCNLCFSSLPYLVRNKIML